MRHGGHRVRLIDAGRYYFKSRHGRIPPLVVRFVYFRVCPRVFVHHTRNQIGSYNYTSTSQTNSIEIASMGFNPTYRLERSCTLRTMHRLIRTKRVLSNIPFVLVRSRGKIESRAAMSCSRVECDSSAVYD